jgi:DNA helicase-2/ATP-dependent DNA helicase PcrA
MDQGDAQDLMQLARGALGLAKSAKRFPKKETLHYLYSRHVNTELPLDELLHRDLPHFLEYEEQIVSLFADYTLRKQERNLVDYDDLLLFWAMMLEASPDLASRIAGLYEHVLVDEYQDTNLLQARILKGMCAGHRKLTVVGDDAQSIYSFRGAHFRNILDFPKAFPDTTLVTLAQNYRSTTPILTLSNTLISRAEERFTKDLWTTRPGGEKPWLVTAKDEAQQTRFVVDRVLQLHEGGVPLGEMAVLFRAGYMSADLEIELTNRKIPFEKWGGLKFLEAAHVKDVLAFLRVSDNPRDEVSWYRILMLMPGIGDSTARALMDSMQERAWDPDAFTHLIAPPRARDAHRSLATLLRQLRGVARVAEGEEGGARVASDIAAIRAIYDAVLKEKYDRPEARLADLDQLRTIAASYPSRSAFLAALALDPPSSTQDLAGGSESESDCLVLSTVHSAKGKEWKAVFLIWAVDGWFPSSRAVETPTSWRRSGGSCTWRSPAPRTSWRSSIPCRCTARGEAPTTRSISSRASSTGACEARCSASSSRSRARLLRQRQFQPASPPSTCAPSCAGDSGSDASRDASARGRRLSAGLNLCPTPAGHRMDAFGPIWPPR